MKSIDKVVFLGSKSFGIQVLKTIYGLRPESLCAVITFDDRTDTRSDLNGFKSFSESTGKPLFIAKSASEAGEMIRSIRPDLCLVVCWYWMLKDELINEIPHGAIGVHNSLLPKYRGGSPLVWAILNGEEEIGFSIFSLNSEMDAGQLWFQEKLTLPNQMHVGEALKCIETRLIETLHEGWCGLLDGEVRPRDQEREGATYCAQRVPDDGRIDWSKTDKNVVNFIRAQSPPYPGAFAVLRDKKIVIPTATVWDYPYFGVPGQVARVTQDGVFIICGNSRAVFVRTVLLDGLTWAAKDVFNSINIRL